MERPERMPGVLPPPNPRGLPENPAQGRRQVPNSAATSNGPKPPPPPPIPNFRMPPAGSSLSASNAASPGQVIALAREAMRYALENESQAADATAVGSGLKTGVTIDLSRKNIKTLPEEVVDILKDELERCAAPRIRDGPLLTCRVQCVA